MIQVVRDQAYQNYEYSLPELKHHYGDQVHLLADPIILSQLAKLCRPDTLQPEVTNLVRDIYHALVRSVIANELPLDEVEVRTRMFNATPNGVWAGRLIDRTTKVVTVDIARAGTLPSQIAFETLTRMVNPDAVRQDHIYMNRVTDENGEVVGTSLSGSKIGGSIDQAIVLFPDPMGATGGSMSRAIDLYKSEEKANPLKLISLNLIVTPEFLRRMQDDHPEVIVYAARLDRGLSEPHIFKTELGERWDEERGLNERQYIVPGAGGLGEILNNSYV